jgi:hypothetical protein
MRKVEGNGYRTRGEMVGCPKSAITIRYGKISVGIAVARPSAPDNLSFFAFTTTLKRKVEIDVYVVRWALINPD